MVKIKYNIERKYINNKLARSKQKNNVKFLVAHETANNTANADNHFTYFNNITFSASAHTFIDDGKILEIIPLDEKAWHVQRQQDKQVLGLGAANDNAIGTELCRTGNFKKAYDRYVWYHAYLCKKFGLQPKKHIVSHKVLDPQRRSDPQSWLSPNGVTWDQFINDTQKYFDQWDGKGKPTDKPKPEPSKPKNKTISQMAKEVIAGRHGNGVENRRKSLGISKSEMAKVQSDVNKQLGGSSIKPKGKSINQMAREVIDGKHGNGHANRQKSLGISKSDYDKVRAEVNKIAGGSKQSSKPKSLKVGQKVKIKSSAKNYTRTPKPVAIPAKYKNKSLTIQQVGNDDVLIKELVSWVKKTDVQ